MARLAQSAADRAARCSASVSLEAETAGSSGGPAAWPRARESTVWAASSIWRPNTTRLAGSSSRATSTSSTRRATPSRSGARRHAPSSSPGWVGAPRAGATEGAVARAGPRRGRGSDPAVWPRAALVVVSARPIRAPANHRCMLPATRGRVPRSCTPLDMVHVHSGSMEVFTIGNRAERHVVAVVYPRRPSRKQVDRPMENVAARAGTADPEETPSCDRRRRALRPAACNPHPSVPGQRRRPTTACARVAVARRLHSATAFGGNTPDEVSHSIDSIHPASSHSGRLARRPPRRISVIRLRGRTSLSAGDPPGRALGGRAPRRADAPRGRARRRPRSRAAGLPERVLR